MHTEKPLHVLLLPLSVSVSHVLICIYSVITFITSCIVPPVPSSACVMYYTWFKHVNIPTFPLIFQFPPPPMFRMHITADYDLCPIVVTVAAGNADVIDSDSEAVGLRKQYRARRRWDHRCHLTKEHRGGE